MLTFQARFNLEFIYDTILLENSGVIMFTQAATQKRHVGIDVIPQQLSQILLAKLRYYRQHINKNPTGWLDRFFQRISGHGSFGRESADFYMRLIKQTDEVDLLDIVIADAVTFTGENKNKFHKFDTHHCMVLEGICYKLQIPRVAIIDRAKKDKFEAGVVTATLETPPVSKDDTGQAMIDLIKEKLEETNAEHDEVTLDHHKFL